MKEETANEEARFCHRAEAAHANEPFATTNHLTGFIKPFHMNHIGSTPSARVPSDTTDNKDPGLDRRTRFSELLSQALEQQHDGALEVLLDGARSDRDPQMIKLVGQQYSHACPGQKDRIDRWADTLSHQQWCAFGEELEFVLVDLPLPTNKSDRYFEQIGRQRAKASDEQKALIDDWQKKLSYSQRVAYLSGMGALAKLNAVCQQVSHFVDDKTLLSLRMSNKYLGHHIDENQAARLIAAKASQLRGLSADDHFKAFFQLLSDTKALSDPHEQLVALEGLARAVDARPEVGPSEFAALLGTTTTLEPEFQVRPLTLLAPHLASWKFAQASCYRHLDLLDAIQKLPRPEWRFAPLQATILATKGSPIYSKAIEERLKLFVSMEVEDLPYRHLHTWTQLLKTFFDSGHCVGATERRSLVEKTQAAIEKLPAAERDSLLPLLPNAQG